MKQVDIIEAARHYRVGDLLIKAVDNVSLEIDKGDFVSIVGHSGSGKTTLLSLMGGIIRPTSGKILFEGVDLCSSLTTDCRNTGTERSVLCFSSRVFSRS